MDKSQLLQSLIQESEELKELIFYCKIYLPYDVVVTDGVSTPLLLTVHNFNTLVGDKKKPVLRPLSSIDLKWFKKNIDEDLEDFRINCEPENNHFSVEVCSQVLGWSALSLEEYQLFYRYRVDIHGLIDRGLAIPFDGKETNS